MTTPTPAEVGARRREPLYKLEIRRLTLFEEYSTDAGRLPGDSDIRTSLWRVISALVGNYRKPVPNRVTIGYSAALALYRLGALLPSHFIGAKELHSTAKPSILLSGWSLFGQPLELLIVNDEKQPTTVSHVEKPVT